MIQTKITQKTNDGNEALSSLLLQCPPNSFFLTSSYVGRTNGGRSLPPMEKNPFISFHPHSTGHCS